MDPRGAPTNYTNFSRRFNANKDVAKREAGKYAAQATDAAGKAAGSLADSQAQFAQGVNTGTVQSPTGAPSTNTGGGAQPMGIGATMLLPQSNTNALTGESTKPTPQPAGQNSAALDGESTKPTQAATAGAPASTWQGNQDYVDSTTGLTIAQMLAKAGQTYTGPMGLDTTQASIDANAAQQQLNLLKDNNGIQTLVNEGGPSGSTGADALSGALIGSAGRGDFDALRAKFNPNKDISDAQAKAQKTAEDAQASSAANAEQWNQSAARAEGDAAKSGDQDYTGGAQEYADAAKGLIAAAKNGNMGMTDWDLPEGTEADGYVAFNGDDKKKITSQFTDETGLTDEEISNDISQMNKAEQDAFLVAVFGGNHVTTNPSADAGTLHSLAAKLLMAAEKRKHENSQKAAKDKH